MKLLPVILLVVASALPLGAEEAIQNGDFTDGTSHWHGDGRSSADFASDNPLQASDPFTAKGMIIPLKQTSWTKAEQVIRPNGSGGVLTITYKLSKDLVFSDKPDYYKNISAEMGWGWLPFGGPPGAWLIDVTDSTGTKGHYDLIKPKTGTSDPQVAKMKIAGLAPHDETTVTLGFPPGTGMIVILEVSLDAQ
jgi:hypothetical protein